jgi:hypothetical protein
MGQITEVEIINKKTGENKLLFERPGSYCHFMDKFSFGKFLIQLRLDWADLDGQYQEPILDADIYILNEAKGKKRKYKSKKDLWHHTSIEKENDGDYMYHFIFKNLELLLKRRIKIQSVFDGKIRIVGGSINSL